MDPTTPPPPRCCPPPGPLLLWIWEKTREKKHRHAKHRKWERKTLTREEKRRGKERGLVPATPPSSSSSSSSHLLLSVCLSVWSFLCPLKTCSLLSCLFKKVFVSLTICNSPPQTQKRKKKKKSCFKSFAHSLKFCSGWIESRGLGLWKSFSEGFVRVVFEDLLRLTFSILCGIIPTEREIERERERERGIRGFQRWPQSDLQW